MAKKETTEVAKSDNSALLKAVAAGEKVSNKDLGALLKSLNSNPENEITAEYIKLEPGESARLFFIDMVPIKSLNEKEAEQGIMGQAARFVDEDGMFCINADVVVVSTLSKLTKPTPVELLCTGEKGPKGRVYKTFRVIQLD